MNFTDPNFITWSWFIIGILLMLSELLIPGLVVIFFGAAAIIVAIGRWIGLIDTLITSFAVWVVTSLIFAIGLRRLVKRFFPADTSYQPLEEDSDAYGAIVEVIETVTDNNDSGRIRYKGTTWPAISEEGTIQKGKKVKLLYRDNLAWIVEPCSNFNDIEKS